MDKAKWSEFTDEQKTTFMRNVFKDMNFSDNFDYAKCRKLYDRMTEAGHGTYGVYKNPVIVLELVDPIMACYLMSWMYSSYNDEGERADSREGQTAPLFGYNMVELTFDKGSLMGFSDNERSVLMEAMRIIGEKIKEKE